MGPSLAALAALAAARTRLGPDARFLSTAAGAVVAGSRVRPGLLRGWAGRYLLPTDWALDVAATYLTLMRLSWHTAVMASSIHDVLDELRDSALDTRDQGDKFEQLVLHFLRTDPEWVQRFSQVWLWRDWPGRDTRTDTGVDIVARHRDRDGLAAIQCK